MINKKILVIVAHPDDELIGLGGTLNKLSRDNNIRVVILGQGVTSRFDDVSLNEENLRRSIELHEDCIQKAKQIINYNSLGRYNLPDNSFDTIPLLKIIKIVEKEAFAFNPDIVFTHHCGDVNIDHRLTFNAVITAFRPVTNQTTIISFETFSGTEWQPSTEGNQFIPNFYFEITEDNLKSKQEAMEQYILERRSYPHPRSSEGLKIHAEYRGITVGLKYCEAFVIVRGFQNSFI